MKVVSIKQKHEVKFHNLVNELATGTMTPREKDLFHAICYKAKDKGTNTIDISFRELRCLASYSSRSNKLLAEDLMSSYETLIKLNLKFLDKHKFVGFTLFRTYEIDFDEKMLTVEIDPRFVFILNDLQREFTSFELEEYTSLHTGYAKDIYTLLKQYKTTGLMVISIEDFRKKLDIPESFTISKIDSRILKPSVDILSKYFKGLKAEKVRSYGSKEVTSIKFTFQKQTKTSIDLDELDIIDV